LIIGHFSETVEKGQTQDLNGNIVAWNKGAEQMYGWREPEALEMNIRHLH
jgi:PAS domain S-box-containing protein